MDVHTSLLWNGDTAGKSWADLEEEEELIRAQIKVPQAPIKTKDAELFEMLEKNSREGFNLAFKTAFQVKEDGNDGWEEVGKKRGKRLPKVASPSPRPSKSPRMNSDPSRNIASPTGDASTSRMQIDEEDKENSREELWKQNVPNHISTKKDLAFPPLAKLKEAEAKPAVAPAPLQYIAAAAAVAPPSIPAEAIEIEVPSTATTPSEEAVAEEQKSQEIEAVEAGGDTAVESVDEDGTKKRTNAYSSKGGAIPRRTGRETNPARLAQREKQIRIGKATDAYQLFVSKLPWGRARPRTPDKFQICSKRSWDGQVSKWRRQLHAFDPPEKQAEALKKKEEEEAAKAAQGGQTGEEDSSVEGDDDDFDESEECEEEGPSSSAKQEKIEHVEEPLES